MSNTQKTLHFDRLEVKYLVDRTTRTALTRDLKALMSPDKHAGPDGSYQVRSLYYDTAAYMAYHEKIDGTAVRHKLRLRAYGEDPSQTPHVRFEVKSRYLSYIYKVTVDVSREDYEEIDCAIQRHELPPAHLLGGENVSKEFFRLKHQYNFQPTVLLQYRREAYERNEMNRVRANFDDNIIACRDLDLLGPMYGSRRILSYGHSVFEIKVDNVLPYWMHMLISKYNLENRAFSKYCFTAYSESLQTNVSRPNIGY